MARTYGAGAEHPLLDGLWGFAFSSTNTLKEVDQISGQYLDSASQLFPRQSTDSSSQYLGSTFKPSHTLASYPTFGSGGHQQTVVCGEIPNGIGSSDAYRSTYGPIHGSNQPNSKPSIPNLPSGYEGFLLEYQDLLNDADVTAVVPHDPLIGLDVINHADGSFFAQDAPDELRSQLDSGWSGNIHGDDAFVDFDGSHQILNPVEHVNTSILEDSPPSFEASSSRTRFFCHHPRCGGRTFRRRSDRDRHVRVHDYVREYVCPKGNCVKKFYRKDKLQNHLKKGH